jgi:hypothetical protein
MGGNLLLDWSGGKDNRAVLTRFSNEKNQSHIPVRDSRPAVVDYVGRWMKLVPISATVRGTAAP